MHFGEKFDSGNCSKTCDNCSKIKTLVEKDVTDGAKQLVKRHRHETLSLHGAGKHLAKGEACRILRHLVTEDFLLEDVKKSDVYGSVSSVLKVNESKVHHLWSGGHTIRIRNATLQHLSKRVPRTKEELLEINGIGKAKVSKYGDRLLETIEATIREYYRTDKNDSSSNDSNDSGKRRREANKAPNGVGEDDEFSKSTARSKRRAGQKKDAGVSNPNKENKEIDYQNRCLDDDLDFEDSYQDLETNYSELSGTGRVLPSWSTTPGDKINNGCKQNVTHWIQSQPGNTPVKLVARKMRELAI
ncbi:hypothetical protein Tsubulata_040067, partial [Turnera subulata]